MREIFHESTQFEEEVNLTGSNGTSDFRQGLPVWYNVLIFLSVLMDKKLRKGAT